MFIFVTSELQGLVLPFLFMFFFVVSELKISNVFSLFFSMFNCWCFNRYYRMFEATQDGLGKNAPVHSIHGSLLAVGELLRLV